jgi:hypothetical protein
MIDPERQRIANAILGNDPEFMRLRGVFNALGIFRFLVYVVVGIAALVAGVNQAYGILIAVCSIGFVVVLIIEYNRAATRARQQGRALALGVITEDDIR